jgi:hypothetical protein
MTFDLEPHTRVLRHDSYIVSYPHLLSYFAPKDTFDAADLVRGAHMAYGWMPTIVELYPGPPNIDLDDGAQLLTRAKRDGTLSDKEIESLASLVNNSLVGASKLLHFVAPTQFAIWDSKIYAFTFEEKPHNYRVNQVKKYRHYLDTLARLQGDQRFNAFHGSVNGKVGYDVSPLRALELVMFLNASVFGG